MEITFYSDKEYRKFIRSLSKETMVKTLTKPWEFPIKLYLPNQR